MLFLGQLSPAFFFQNHFRSQRFQKILEMIRFETLIWLTSETQFKTSEINMRDTCTTRLGRAG